MCRHCVAEKSILTPHLHIGWSRAQSAAFLSRLFVQRTVEEPQGQEAMTKFGKRLIKGLEEAVAVAKGEARPAKIYGDVDVAKIRAKLKLSQSEFAEMLDVSKRVVQDWEQRRKAPSGAARSLLRVAQKMPAAVRRALAH
jgi:putative transcriptional regulator